MSETTAALPGTPTQAELEQIRRYTRRDFAPEELYVFPAVLCDNQIDRDGERFSRDCLRELAELFVGVTGVFDHRASAEGQHARIFAARVVEDPSRPTNCGEPYTALRAEIYMPRNEKTAGLIAEIDAGIKKEVSVSCAVSRSVCSVCGEPAGTCSHQRGKRYGEIPCHVIHCAATDAYEWSFVAVPAQPLAGVTKSVRQTHREAAAPGERHTSSGCGRNMCAVPSSPCPNCPRRPPVPRRWSSPPRGSSPTPGPCRRRRPAGCRFSPSCWGICRPIRLPLLTPTL